MENETVTNISNVKPEGNEFLVSDNPLINKQKKMIIAGVFAAALIVLLAAYFIGGRNMEFLSPLSRGSGGSMESVQNILTGEVYRYDSSMTWVGERPLAVMMNNHIDARPQSGLIYADLVYEIVAEGGITRFLVFYAADPPEKIGPVRSTREYYLVLVKELADAMIMHIGWSPQALEAIEIWPVRSLQRGGATFWRDNPDNVATEHTAYVDGGYLRQRGNELGWSGIGPFRSWEFKQDDPVQIGEGSDDIVVNNISIDFWYEGDYSAVWEYDSERNSYLRLTGYDGEGNPVPHVDRETGEQVEVRNVIVQFAEETGIEGDDKNRLEYTIVGSGTGLVFMDGRVIEATWNKEGRDERTLFFDLDGNEIRFNRGKVWISIVPERNVDQVSY